MAQAVTPSANTRIAPITRRYLPSAMTGLFEAAKSKAKAESRTFTSVVEEGLRRALATQPVETKPVELPAYGSPGGRVLVDLLDREAVWGALDAEGLR